jgi:cell fate regulator YaaT (PSP1 superfamily)
MAGTNVIGVQFRRAGRIYDFSAGDLDLRVGDAVVVDTDRGPSLAKVAQVRFDDGVHGLKPVTRVASRKDLEEARKLTPEAAARVAKERADRLGLKMTVLQSEVQFGGNKVIIFFSATGRVDFRDLVKDLASSLKARVELKQVGARDEAKLVGGIGVCGREFCCSSFLRDFVPVSIKMAKNQNLALNPSKVSGGCGRLLCCLTYENDQYTEMRKSLPPKNAQIRCLDDGVVGRVLKGDVLNQTVLIEVSTDGRLMTVPIASLEVVMAAQGGGAPAAREAEESESDGWGEDLDIAALAGLEDDSGGGKKGGTTPPGGQGGKGEPPAESGRGGRTPPKRS